MNDEQFNELISVLRSIGTALLLMTVILFGLCASNLYAQERRVELPSIILMLPDSLFTIGDTSHVTVYDTVLYHR